MSCSQNDLLPRLLSSLRRLNVLDEPLLLSVLHCQLSLILDRLRLAYAAVHTSGVSSVSSEFDCSSATGPPTNPEEQGRISSSSDQNSSQEGLEPSSSRKQVSLLSQRAIGRSDRHVPTSLVLHPFVSALLSVVSTPTAAKRLAEGALQLSTCGPPDTFVGSALVKGEGGGRAGEARSEFCEGSSSRDRNTLCALTYHSLSDLLEWKPREFSVLATNTYMSSIDFLSALVLWLSRAREDGAAELAHGPFLRFSGSLRPLGPSTAGDSSAADVPFPGNKAGNTVTLSLQPQTSPPLSELTQSPVVEHEFGTERHDMRTSPGCSHYVWPVGPRARATRRPSPVVSFVVPSLSCFGDMLRCLSSLPSGVLSPLHLHAAAACAEFITHQSSPTGLVHLSSICGGLRALGKVLMTAALRGPRSGLRWEPGAASSSRSGSCADLSSEASPPGGSRTADHVERGSDLIPLLRLVLGSSNVFSMTANSLLSQGNEHELSREKGSEHDSRLPKCTAPLECSSGDKSISGQGQSRLPCHSHYRLLEILCNFDLGGSLSQPVRFYGVPRSSDGEEKSSFPITSVLSANLGTSPRSSSVSTGAGGGVSAMAAPGGSPEVARRGSPELLGDLSQGDSTEYTRLHSEGVLSVVSIGDRLLRSLDDCVYSSKRGGRLSLADAVSLAFWCCMRLVTEDGPPVRESYFIDTEDALGQTKGSNTDLDNRIKMNGNQGGPPASERGSGGTPREAISAADSVRLAESRTKCLDHRCLERTLARSLLAAASCVASGRGPVKKDVAEVERERILLMIQGEDRSLLLLAQS